jgi:hypothetical protein
VDGSLLGGYSLNLLDGRLPCVHDLSGEERHVIAAAELVPPGRLLPT